MTVIDGIDLVLRLGSLAIAILIAWVVRATLKRGFFLYGDRRVTRSNEPGDFWTVLVIWILMALACALFAFLGPSRQG